MPKKESLDIETEHDFKKFPELTNRQMQIFYFESPHKQIWENFNARVNRVIDGDTIEVEANFRNFLFPIRLNIIDAPEMDEVGGLESALWLKNKIEGKEVEIIIDPKNRVEKFGRLLGDIIADGELISEASLREKQSRIFGEFREGEIPPQEFWIE